MYCQITSRCNMSCAHCCFSATKRGKDMSIDIFRKAIDLANENDDYLTIGGGEPTIHPQFETILALACTILSNTPFIITNGSITKHSLLVAKLIKSKKLDGQLSQDIYHNKIDTEVVRAFSIVPNGIRNTTQNHAPIAAGRAVKEVFSANKASSCACTDTFIRPDGKIYQCGCKGAKSIGDVWSGYTPQVNEYSETICYFGRTES